jgi:16S rRNA processing protein RimM
VGIPRETAPSLPPHTYYHYDIIGLKVISDGQFMGRIKEILSTGANDVYVVEREGQEWLLPAVKEVIERVDLEREVLYITPIEGLIDLEAV